MKCGSRQPSCIANIQATTGRGNSSRLYREIQQKRGLVHSIEAGCYTPGQPGLFIIEALADADKREPATTAIEVSSTSQVSCQCQEPRVNSTSQRRMPNP